jgi:hypothetical protein
VFLGGDDVGRAQDHHNRRDEGRQCQEGASHILIRRARS